MYLCILLLKLFYTFSDFVFNGMSDSDLFVNLNFIVLLNIDFELNLLVPPDCYTPAWS